MTSTSLKRSVYSGVDYPKVINTNFEELVQTEPTTVEEPVTVEKFFQEYEQLFFEIPVRGSTNSHEYLIKRSSEYVGEAVMTDNEKALLEEINSLRQQLLEANQLTNNISNLVK